MVNRNLFYKIASYYTQLSKRLENPAQNNGRNGKDLLLFGSIDPEFGFQLTSDEIVMEKFFERFNNPAYQARQLFPDKPYTPDEVLTAFTGFHDALQKELFG